MRHKLSQNQRLLQKMALTPQMRQSIQLLGMSTKDLHEYIDTIVTANPFLKKLFEAKKGKPAVSYEYKDALSPQKEDPRLSLLSQIRMSNLDKKGQEIAEYLIYEMDDNGYITVDLEEVANDLFTDIEEVQKALEVIQGLEPAGIGACDVRECLQLQLRHLGKQDSLEYTLVTDFINEVAKNDINKIAKALKIDIEKVKKAVNTIKKLNPRPASTILSKGAERIVPDIIAKVGDTKVQLEINRDWLPRIKLYNPYEDKLEIIQDKEAKKFLKENMGAAKNLIDTLKRREETMCKVADYILNFQKNALGKDGKEIKTLTIRNIAEALKLHPSTISRTVSNKYIQIENEVVPLKNLLSHGIKKENGEMTSKTAIKKRIEEIVRNEDKSHPLSDNSLKERLSQEGIMIKRRTVAKYRESLRILPTHLRKKKEKIGSGLEM